MRTLLFGGMFDWIYDIFYAISKSMYAIIDNLLATANMLCGIEPIVYKGAEMDFVTFLLRNRNISYAFVGATLVGVVLVVLFGIIAILRTIASEKIEKTPAQIAVTIAKTALTFLFIPAAMTVLIFFTNTIMRVLYQTTLGGSPDGLGRFLAGAFGQDAVLDKYKGDPLFYLNENFKYSSTDNVKEFLDLKDYNYFFSYIASLCIILSLGMALLMFVDRAISIVVLFIFSPISMATTVLDDGARFKLWRDQFIVKFLTGYGCIIAINIYALIIAAISDTGLVFFQNDTLNFFMKIVIIVGGGVSMTRMMALVGNLISAGAGSNEMRDQAIATSGFRRAMVGGAMGAFSATRGAVNFVRDSKNLGFGTALGHALGFRTTHDYNKERSLANRGGGGGNGGSGSGNHNSSKGGGGTGNKVRDAIGGGAKKVANAAAGAGSNAVNKGSEKMIEMQDLGSSRNNNNPGSGMVNNAVNNALNNKKGDKK